MEKPKKVIAYTGGDSTKPSTWSNFPYFFLKTMEEKGIEVVRVNTSLEESNPLLRLFIKGYNKIYRKLRPGGVFTFGRKAICTKLVRKKMKRALDQNPDADLLISFDFSNSIADLTDIKTLLLCDWTIEYFNPFYSKKRTN